MLFFCLFRNCWHDLHNAEIFRFFFSKNVIEGNFRNSIEGDITQPDWIGLNLRSSKARLHQMSSNDGLALKLVSASFSSKSIVVKEYSALSLTLGVNGP